MDFWNKPLATAPHKSYRYRGRYGWIMVGAKTDAEALREVSRSTDEKPKMSKLERWDEVIGYISA